MNKKGIAIGESDFKSIIERNDYYFDKTSWIEELIKDSARIKLFTRPRRFGKTLNMTTLKYFFSMRNAEENKKLFEGLDISKSEYFKYQGQYPVLFLSLKDVKQSSWENCFDMIRGIVRDLYLDYEEVKENLDEIRLDDYRRILLSEKPKDYKKSLKFLCECIYKHYGKKVILLIDEYDTPLVAANMYEYFEGEARDFFRDFYSTVLKDNEYLEMAVLTGIVRVAKENIFSGLNNLEVYDILNPEYPSYFGLTQKEIESALKYYEVDFEIDKVRDWYDGYKFGGIEIYNPWSITKYLKYKELGAYWVNTSDNLLIYDTLKKGDLEIIEDLKQLIERKELVKSLDKGFSFEDLKVSPSYIWQLMVASGYLRVIRKLNDDPMSFKYLVDIPNLEILSFFERDFIRRFMRDPDYFRELIDSLVKGDIYRFEERLKYIFMTSPSHFDFKQEEANYHLFILGMLIQLKREYKVKSNLETGYGRTDVLVLPYDKNKLGFVFEFKVSKNIEELETKAEEALKQIDEKDYEVIMQDEKIEHYFKIGISFYKKDLAIKYEEIEK
nr:AAA family ATPase [uncultured Fusobacterium sp.]